ncbi:MAG: DUF5615 family PIN-like protein [Hyphomonadaceae bacterium]|nr:DUF5615 family PIN-like protein [Hyphomonadaceae bacterium]
MKLWLDNHLSPTLCPWLSVTFGIEAVSIRDLGMASELDVEVFSRAGLEGVVIATKDADFVVLLERLGPPPQILWLTFGNTSNDELKRIFSHRLGAAIALLRDGEPLVEISAVGR